MSWSGDKIPTTANNDLLPFFFICSVFVCLNGYYLQLQYIKYPTETINSVKGEDGMAHRVKIHQGILQWSAPSGV